MTTGIDGQIRAKLDASEIRYTKGRRLVAKTLAEADGPLSAGEISGRLGPTVPVSSIYRTLAIFTETDVVTPHLSTKGLARYELAEWLSGHHHHLVCVGCGTVEDIIVTHDDERAVETIVNSIASATSFTPSNHALEIEGTCERCA
jgi:Fe2+ or Zn2+ uptake regulation protein